ncbi:DUF3800 domain-containing protein [Conexibacter sp. CPCC 206217]|uniref:DUF3800 domain-containing protein n=1 Tax=Conexibacter sp. CPCC 206217 TaxID=3064574 RepID=UPI00271583FB|nr:DUF3800 domain-containing protein [Conexibacter sp. CPCC 206217]MDO8208948.1 DUF3800 domain-containing protein [Conexibacter sp. CPCC 206217]
MTAAYRASADVHAPRDESGKSGLKDLKQPFHVLEGLAVHDGQWQAMEKPLNARIDTLVPPPRAQTWELHMTDMVNGKGCFRGVNRGVREALCNATLDVIDAHRPTFIFIALDKQKHVAKYTTPGPPEDITYEFMIERFDRFLKIKREVGVIVSDDQKGSEDQIRRAHSRYRRGGTSWSKIDHIIETPFFAPSHWSRMLQVVDMATWLPHAGQTDELRLRVERIERALLRGR